MPRPATRRRVLAAALASVAMLSACTGNADDGSDGSGASETPAVAVDAAGTTTNGAVSAVASSLLDGSAGGAAARDKAFTGAALESANAYAKTLGGRTAAEKAEAELSTSGAKVLGISREGDKPVQILAQTTLKKSPTVPDGKNFGGAAEGWTGSTLLASAARAGHPRQFQGVALASASGTPIGTRLRGVRSGATVTLTWDDNPDACVSSGGGRPYTVSVAGADNAPGSYTTKDATGQANWFTGRSYSFTAAEDAPAVTFTFGTPSTAPNCRAMITNVQAFQTPPPVPPPSASQTDPCAGDQAGSPACTTNAGNKEKLDKCPATSRDCLDSVAGKGEQENAGIDQQTQALADFTNTPREQDPNAALGGLCQVANLHNENLEPGDTVLAPGTWWYC